MCHKGVNGIFDILISQANQPTKTKQTNSQYGQNLRDRNKTSCPSSNPDMVDSVALPKTDFLREKAEAPTTKHITIIIVMCD